MTSVKLLQSSNTLLPIVVTLGGTVIPVKLLQPLNVLSSITVSPVKYCNSCILLID